MALLIGAYGGGTIIGKLGSTVFQRNQYGNLARQRVSGVNPNSLPQQLVRGQMAAMSARWKDVLTAAQRLGWKDYSTGTPLPNNRGGNSIVGGRQMFLRFNVAWTLSGASPVDDAPATPGVATPIVLALNASTTVGLQILGVNPAVPTSGLVQVRYSIPLNQSVEYYKNPWTTAFYLTDTETYPKEIKPPASVAIGQKYFTAARLFQPDGKVSEITTAAANVSV